MGDHVFLKVMPKRERLGLVSGESYGCLLIGTTANFIDCSCGNPCLHAPEVYSRSDSCSGLGQACC